nr:hypothetical protein HmN_000960300 [Hymenolepis microstoma]
MHSNFGGVNIAQSMVNDEFALPEDGSQHMLEKCQHQAFSRCKSVREGGKRSVRQAHSLKRLGLRHRRAQVKAAKNKSRWC